MQQTDARLHEQLANVGYRLDWGHDQTGVFGKSFRRGGGFYIDVGCAALLADGRVGLRSGCEVERLEPRAVVLTNGERLEADVLIHATGFSSMHQFVEGLISAEAAQAVGRVWGCALSGLQPAPLAMVEP